MKLYSVVIGLESITGKIHYEDVERFLFKSYREASEWIMLKKELEPFPDLFLGHYRIKFEFKDEYNDIHYAYIQEHELFEGF